MEGKCVACNHVGDVGNGNERYNFETEKWDEGRTLCPKCLDAEELGQKLLNCGYFAQIILEGLRSGEIWMGGGVEA